MLSADLVATLDKYYPLSLPSVFDVQIHRQHLLKKGRYEEVDEIKP